MARELSARVISATVKELFLKATVLLPQDMEEAIRAHQGQGGLEGYVMASILKNSEIAREENIPLCQDTGAAIVFVQLGQDVHIVDGFIGEAIQQGVREAYGEGFLRKSICNPLSRKNTSDNTPTFIHYDVVAGDSLTITAMPKGGGAENASLIEMLTPAEGIEGIKKLVINHLRKVGRNACPPLTVGIGIGATLESVGVLAKKALLLPLKAINPDPTLAHLEAELLVAINNLGFGAGGYGGWVSAFGVHILTMPCHIACLPVAINIQCHAARHLEVQL
ncbi:MAG: fumarate hydratase [Deltaproteobacteria bacterium]|nr:fumarate hydratase [Deltaproteobacteria bacterium]